MKLLGRYVPVRAEVLALRCFSVHADEDELFGWLADAPHPPDVAYVVHGEPDAADIVRQRMSHELAWPAVVPRHRERVRID